MAATNSRVRSGDESNVHNEPHTGGSRVTVQHIHERVEGRGLRPETVAERLNLALADVYRRSRRLPRGLTPECVHEALAYYHRNPEEMREIEARRRAVTADAETPEKPE